MLSNDSRHENNSQLELADGAKCSKRFISKVTSIFRRKFDLVMPLSRIQFLFPRQRLLPSWNCSQQSTELKYTWGQLSEFTKFAQFDKTQFKSISGKHIRKYKQVFSVGLLVTPAFSPPRAYELTSDVSCASISRSPWSGSNLVAITDARS